MAVYPGITMRITAAMVKELRDRTGAGIMECKQALTANSGDMEAAVKQMRKSGQAKADKKAGRIVAEGTVVIATDGKQAAIVEVNCETDFVAKDDQFQAFSKCLADMVLDSGISTVGELKAAIMESGQTVEQSRLELIAKIGENIQVRRLKKIHSEQGIIANYSHGNRIGVLLDIAGGNATLGKDIAMHVAASSPVCVSEKDVPADLLEKEREIFMAQAEAGGKPAEIIAKVVQGKLRKYLKEITLLNQPFVKDPDQTIAELLETENAIVISFVRFEVGEGIEKKSEDFAEEVRKQVASKSKLR